MRVNSPGETTVLKRGRVPKRKTARGCGGFRGNREVRGGDRGKGDFYSRTVYSLISTFLETADLVAELEDLGLVVVVLDGQFVVGPF